MRSGRRRLWAATMATATAALMTAQAFQMPSSAQVRATADNPVALAQLARGSSPEQAAAILVAALAELLAKNMDAAHWIYLGRQLTDRFMGLFTHPQRDEFGQALGRAIARNFALRARRDLVSIVQGAVAQASGHAAHLFAVAYTHEVGISIAASGQPDNTPSRLAPPVATERPSIAASGQPASAPSRLAPPVATGYPNQPL